MPVTLGKRCGRFAVGDDATRIRRRHHPHARQWRCRRRLRDHAGNPPIYLSIWQRDAWWPGVQTRLAIRRQRVQAYPVEQTATRHSPRGLHSIARYRRWLRDAVFCARSAGAHASSAHPRTAIGAQSCHRQATPHCRHRLVEQTLSEQRTSR